MKIIMWIYDDICGYCDFEAFGKKKSSGETMSFETKPSWTVPKN